LFISTVSLVQDSPALLLLLTAVTGAVTLVVGLTSALLDNDEGAESFEVEYAKSLKLAASALCVVSVLCAFAIWRRDTVGIAAGSIFYLVPGLSILMLVEIFSKRISVSATTIRDRSMWRGTRSLSRADLVGVGFYRPHRSIPARFYLETRTHERIYFNVLLRGWRKLHRVGSAARADKPLGRTRDR
jgi:hypothetical protein